MSWHCVNYLTNVQAGYEKFKDVYSADQWLKSEMCKAGHVDINKFWEQLSPFLQLHVLASGSLIPKAELRAACAAVLGGQAGEKYCCG